MSRSRCGSAEFDSTTFQCRSTAEAGYGLCAVSTRSMALLAASSSVSARSGKAGAKPAREEQHVLLAQRDLQIFGQPRDHFTAGLRLAGFKAGQVSCRARRVREVDLRHAPPLAATPQEDAERQLMFRHPETLVFCF